MAGSKPRPAATASRSVLLLAQVATVQVHVLVQLFRLQAVVDRIRGARGVVVVAAQRQSDCADCPHLLQAPWPWRHRPAQVVCESSICLAIAWAWLVARPVN